MQYFIKRLLDGVLNQMRVKVIMLTDHTAPGASNQKWDFQLGYINHLLSHLSQVDRQTYTQPHYIQNIQTQTSPMGVAAMYVYLKESYNNGANSVVVSNYRHVSDRIPLCWNSIVCMTHWHSWTCV